MDWRFAIKCIREYGWDAFRPAWVGSTAEVCMLQMGSCYSHLSRREHMKLFATVESAYDNWKMESLNFLAPVKRILSCKNKKSLEKLLESDFIFSPRSLVAFAMESKRLGWTYFSKTYFSKRKKYVGHWFIRFDEWLCISYEGEELAGFDNHWKGGRHHHLCLHLHDSRSTWFDYERETVSKGDHRGWHLKTNETALTPDFARQLPLKHPDRVSVLAEETANAAATVRSDQILSGISSRLEFFAEIA